MSALDAWLCILFCWDFETPLIIVYVLTMLHAQRTALCSLDNLHQLLVFPLRHWLTKVREFVMHTYGVSHFYDILDSPMYDWLWRATLFSNIWFIAFCEGCCEDLGSLIGVIVGQSIIGWVICTKVYLEHHVRDLRCLWLWDNLCICNESSIFLHDTLVWQMLILVISLWAIFSSCQWFKVFFLCLVLLVLVQKYN